MKIRVKAFVGRRWWTWDCSTEEAAKQQVNTLLLRGIWSKSKAGVVTVYPPHRINKITLRKINAHV